MTASRLLPATLAFRDGVPFAERFGDVYHSSAGGLAQAHHVFIAGNRLPQRWQGIASFTVLETGFGLGLNFLATWRCWRDDAQRSERLHYVAIEKHPFAAADLALLHARWPELGPLSAELRAQWPAPTPGCHRLLLDHGRVALTLVFGDIAECLPGVEARCDAFYLDGFAPDRNPEMWAPGVLVHLKRLAAPGATLATYTVSAAVRAALADAGFACEKTQGFGRKRHMLVGHYAPRWSVPPRRVPGERRAIVVGAGIAGSALCERLAARGWDVALIDRHAGPAREASGNRAGIVKPLPSRDDNLVSRFTRTAFLFALRHWRHLGGIGAAFEGDACGILQLAVDDGEALAHERFMEGPDAELLRLLDAAEVAALIGGRHRYGGWHAKDGAWVSPPDLCRALLDRCGNRLQRRFANDARALAFDNGTWTVHDGAGAVIANAPVVVFANANAATAFSQCAHLPLQAMRGQVTSVPAHLLPPVPLVICGDGYVTPPLRGSCTVGASFDEEATPGLRMDSQHDNLRRLARLLPIDQPLENLPLDGSVGFRCFAPDRLPLAGALYDASIPLTSTRWNAVPRLPGAYCLLGLGARGLTWAPLLAELLASDIEGEPLPLDREMKEALDPARFALRAYRLRR
jgi:tRNA 5-methylaminomethyl-2-thiouridine biosynthesis bifunctional protein